MTRPKQLPLFDDQPIDGPNDLRLYAHALPDYYARPGQRHVAEAIHLLLWLISTYRHEHQVAKQLASFRPKLELNWMLPDVQRTMLTDIALNFTSIPPEHNDLAGAFLDLLREAADHNTPAREALEVLDDSSFQDDIEADHLFGGGGGSGGRDLTELERAQINKAIDDAIQKGHLEELPDGKLRLTPAGEAAAQKILNDIGLVALFGPDEAFCQICGSHGVEDIGLEWRDGRAFKHMHCDECHSDYLDPVTS